MESPVEPSPRVARAALAFLEELSKERGVGALLRAAHAVLGFPIHLLDPGFCLVALVGGEGLSDPRWLDYIDQGVISEERAARLKKRGFIATLRNVRRPAVDPGEGGQPDVIGCDVVAGGRLLGRLGVWATAPYGDDELGIVLALSRVLAAELQRGQPVAGSNRGDWLLDRLLALPGDEPRVAELAHRMGLGFPGRYRVVVLGNDGEPCRDEYLLDRAATKFSARLGTLREGQIVLLVDWGTFGSLPFVEQYDLRCGLSWEVNGLGDVPQGWRQARAALALAPGSRVCDYDDIFPLDVLALASSTVASRHLCFPPVRRLQEYDQTYGTEYLQTLAVWLRHSGQGTRAATDLGIHYNTMKYRLQVIQEILGVGLDGPGQRFRIEFSLWALGVGVLTLSVN